MLFNKKIVILVLIFTVSLSMISSAEATSAEGIIADSIEVIKKMIKQDDVGDMADVIQNANAIAFVPSLLKAGFILGGEYGEGLILRKQGKYWYGPSFYNLGGGSLGLQIGVQEISLVLVVINEKGVEAFLSSKTKLGADISVAAGPVGRRGEASTDGQLKASIYSYSMTQGLFAGVSLDGSVISISVKRNKEYWKKDITAQEAINKRATDKRILPLIKEIEKISKK